MPTRKGRRVWAKGKRYRSRRYIPRQVGKNKFMLKRLNQMIETKFKELDANSGSIDNGGMLILLNDAIAEGSERIGQREGQQLFAKKIMVRGYFYNNNTGGAGAQDCVVRMIIFRKKATNATAATIGDVIWSYSGGAIGINACRNIEDISKYHVYLDTTFAMDTAGHSIIPFKIQKKLNHKVTYNDVNDAGTIASIETNALYMLLMSDRANDAGNPTMLYQSRYTYSDL